MQGVGTALWVRSKTSQEEAELKGDEALQRRYSCLLWGSHKVTTDMLPHELSWDQLPSTWDIN